MVQRANIGRLRSTVESGFGVDGTGTMGNFVDVRHIAPAGDVSATRAVLPDGRVRSYRVDQPADVLGFRNGEFSVQSHLVATGVAIDASTPAVQDSTSKLLEAILGGYNLPSGAAPQGSLVASGASPTGFVVTGGQGTRFTPGSLCLVETAVASGRYVLAKVKTRSTDTLTFPVALGFTPAVGARVLGMHTLHETDRPTSTLQWLVEGEDRDDIYLLLGCQGDFTMEWPNGGLITYGTKQMFAKYLHDDEIVTPQGGSPLAVATLDGSGPIPAIGGSVVFTPAASTTRTTPNIKSITLNANISWATVEAVLNGVEGRAGYERVPTEITATIRLPFDDESYEDARDAGTKYQLLAQAGATGGNIVALDLGTVIIRDVKHVVDAGLRYQDLTLLCLPDDNATDKTTDVRRAPYRIGRG